MAIVPLPVQSSLVSNDGKKEYQSRLFHARGLHVTRDVTVCLYRRFSQLPNHLELSATLATSLSADSTLPSGS